MHASLNARMHGSRDAGTHQGAHASPSRARGMHRTKSPRPQSPAATHPHARALSCTHTDTNTRHAPNGRIHASAQVRAEKIESTGQCLGGRYGIYNPLHGSDSRLGSRRGPGTFEPRPARAVCSTTDAESFASILFASLCRRVGKPGKPPLQKPQPFARAPRELVQDRRGVGC